MNCKIIEDLLPVYVEKECSEETTKEIDEHVKECENCSQKLKDYEKLVLKENNKYDEITAAKPFKKILKQRVILYSLIFILGLIVTSGGIFALYWYGQSSWSAEEKILGVNAQSIYDKDEDELKNMLTETIYVKEWITDGENQKYILKIKEDPDKSQEKKKENLDALTAAIEAEKQKASSAKIEKDTLKLDYTTAKDPSNPKLDRAFSLNGELSYEGKQYSFRYNGIRLGGGQYYWVDLIISQNDTVFAQYTNLSKKYQ